MSLNIPQSVRDEKKGSVCSIAASDFFADREEKSPSALSVTKANTAPAPKASVRPNVTVEEHVPERVHLELPSGVRHRWQQRVAEARRYSQQLMELCGPTALQLASKLHKLEEHRQERPWIWKEGGHLPVMLEQVSVMLCEASQVAEAVTLLLTSAPGHLDLETALRSVREQCFRATDVEPSIHACLECSTAEEAMALAQVELTRLQGAGSALGCSLRSRRALSSVQLRKEAFREDDQLWEDFMYLVPFLEMTLLKLQRLSDLVFHQLEEDFKVAPPDVDVESPLEGAQTFASVVEGSESFAALWAAQDVGDASDPEAAQRNEEVPVPADEDEEEDAPKTIRKKGKKKTLTKSPKEKAKK